MRLLRGSFLSCVLVVPLVFALAPPAWTSESIPGVTSHYAQVEVNDGSRLQAIITLPEGASAPRNPVLFTQWVSCGSLEYREGSNSRELLATIARDSGLALVRVERSALDDSGPTCEELDYDTEVAHYVEAFSQLLADPRIDAGRVYVYGSSLGSTTAPLVARELQEKGFDIAGIMVQGGGAVTYYERMFNFERIYLERRPDDVAGDSAEMARIRSDILGMEATNQYDRPYTWHQQAAKQNFLGAWAEVRAPVLVIFNAFDQFETRHGHKLIVDTVNRLRPGSATYVERTNIGHSDNRYATIEDAYAFRDGTPAWREAAEIMLDWLRNLDR